MSESWKDVLAQGKCGCELWGGNKKTLRFHLMYNDAIDIEMEAKRVVDLRWMLEKKQRHNMSDS